MDPVAAQSSIQDALAEVARVVAPVWPLRDYVAVNPYAGMSSRRFLDARQFLQSFSDCELLMPPDYYAALMGEQRFSRTDIGSAITELRAAGLAISHTEEQIAALLSSAAPFTPDQRDEFIHRSSSRMRTVAELATIRNGIDWTDVIRDEVSKHCAAHYDEGQATWSSPWTDRSLYDAWRTAATCDRNVEILGLNGFRTFVSELPSQPESALAAMLTQLNVPPQMWSMMLMCQAFSIPGWSAWAKYQSAWKPQSGDASVPASEQARGTDLAGLLAMRLAYDVALAAAKSLTIQWSGWSGDAPTCETSCDDVCNVACHGFSDDVVVRMVLLRASELGFRNSLLNSLDLSESQSSSSALATPTCVGEPKLAQMVFCIDVRSERIRRQIELLADDIDTYGFAGFFGMPIEFVPIGDECGEAHVPALLKPQLKLFEGVLDEHDASETRIVAERHQTRRWWQTWCGFQKSAVGCFAFVETTGVLYGGKLITRALGIHTAPRILRSVRRGGVTGESCGQVGPLLSSLDQQGVTAEQRADLAESMLRGVGLTENFASLVVLCGHGSQTDNNPLAAGLDCGACGGHSGEPNARMAAMLLNQKSTRALLFDRGIEIPDSTHFLAGLHNTTTDQIQYFELSLVPASHTADVDRLIELSKLAGERTRHERMPIIQSETANDPFRRAVDWSEMRPEWALAGNAAFIAAPRSLTRGVNLDGRSFLHSYDARQDPHGRILEAIMTAPLVVAHWINMQYYASTVDSKHFGSGTKTIHNVVGQFGILSGNGGDLMTGLPWQSVHNGSTFQHSPMRLQAIIAAPRDSIDRVLQKHPAVAELVDGAWMHLIAIDAGQSFRRDASGDWSVLE